jgi:glyoxylase-like metal-dependent hydrolase (beta-lactamase superfamily II)
MPSEQRRTFEAAPGIVAVDTRMAGSSRVTSAYLVRADEPALVETGPTTSFEAVVEGLEDLGVGPADLGHIVLTHIHLDHAGGVGRVAERFPRATVWVHERGAPHLADPEKLVSSVARVYGEARMRELFGPVEPVPAGRIRALGDGDRISLGNRSLDVLATPGHASHHVALADDETGAVFVGDALGIHLPDANVLRPATPPPDIDIELGAQSIERIRRRVGSVLLFSHFGPVAETDALCELAVGRLRRWGDIVRGAMGVTDEIDQIAEILRDATDSEFAEAGEDERSRYEILSTMKMNASGLVRYWEKRSEAEQSPAKGRANTAY